MPDRILSTIVYDSITKSYTNLSPSVSPLILNDTGDLIFNTNNLALYNKNSNNKIIRPTGPDNYYFNTVLDNVLIGGNNSKIYGACHSIINSDNSTISGEFYTLPDKAYFSRNNSIANSQNACVLNAYSSSIINSTYSYISGGANQSMVNSASSWMVNNQCSSMMNSWLSCSDGTFYAYNTTGKLLGQGLGGADTNSLFGSLQKFYEVGADMRRFTGVLGTGFANEYAGSRSSVDVNSNSIIFGGSQNTMLTARQGLIANSFCSRLSGATNWNEIGKYTGPYGGEAIACWISNLGNTILGASCSQINNQVQNSAIIGGCCNKIESDFYPIYFSGQDSALKYCRTIRNSAIIGGFRNCMGKTSDASVILGGCENKIYSGICGATILGGAYNAFGDYRSSTDDYSGCFSYIGNGYANTIWAGIYNSIGVGQSNHIYGGLRNSILNGFNNIICKTATGNLIVNGYQNYIYNGENNSIINGKSNIICSTGYSSILGGSDNVIDQSTSHTLVKGGTNNCISSYNCYNSISPGKDNKINSYACYSHIIGGRKAHIQSNHSGAIILSDAQDRYHYSSGVNTLTLDFEKGIYFAQTGVFGQINFSTRPKVNGTGILLNGESSQLPDGVLYTTGNQTIVGTKDFISRPTVNGFEVLIVGDDLGLNNLGFVDLSSNQQIFGVKSFYHTPNVNGDPISTSSQLQDKVDIYNDYTIYGKIDFQQIPTFLNQNFALENNTVNSLFDQEISGTKVFNSQPYFQDKPLATIHDIQTGIANIQIEGTVYTTGNQNINGLKIFSTKPTVNGTGILLFGEGQPSPIQIYNNGVSQGTAASLNFNGGGIFVNTVGSIATISATSNTQVSTIPSSSNSAGVKGSFAISGNYFYFCKENNKWVRTALSDW